MPVASSASFAALYGREPTVRADAPGRVNLIGEHTDYNDGFVLPCAIPQRTTVELSPRHDQTVRAWTANVPGHLDVVQFSVGDEQAGRGWLDYVQGCFVALRDRGFALRGADLRISSEVPAGSGLSSSAALEVAVLRALRRAYDLSLDDVTLALVGQEAEVRFVGAPVGVMDQMAASLADTGTALFIDTRTLEYERVPLPPVIDLLVIDSGVTHRHAGGEYRVRRRECERAAEALGVRALRDCGVADLPRIAELPPPLDRRARHVVTENARVLAAVVALRTGDAARLGELFRESHRSMRDDYAVSVAAVDRLVDVGNADPEVYGARLTGGGFGGAVVMAVHASSAARAGRRIVDRARDRGESPRILVPPEM